MTDPRPGDLSVDPARLRAHAATLDTLCRRLADAQAASAAVARDDSAYGRLCGWISPVLAGRQEEQTRLIGYVRDNLTLAAGALARAGSAYELADDDAADRINRAGRP